MQKMGRSNPIRWIRSVVKDEIEKSSFSKINKVTAKSRPCCLDPVEWSSLLVVYLLCLGAILYFIPQIAFFLRCGNLFWLLFVSLACCPESYY